MLAKALRILITLNALACPLLCGDATDAHHHDGAPAESSGHSSNDACPCAPCFCNGEWLPKALHNADDTLAAAKIIAVAAEPLCQPIENLPAITIPPAPAFRPEAPNRGQSPLLI